MSFLHFPRTAGALLAVLVLGITASSAAAAPYEQINRATGAFGSSPIFGVTPKPTALGDVGRYAGWEEVRNESQQGLYDTNGFVRDIQSNTTFTYGGGVHRVYSIDRAERRVLILRTRAGQQQVVALPVVGGTPIVVAQFPDTVRMPEAVLSGDGRKVVVSQEGYGTKVFDLTGGVARLSRVVSTRWLFDLGARSVSDDASVITGFDQNTSENLIFARNKVYATDGFVGSVVDPSGSSASWISDRGVVLRNLTSGRERTWPVPTSDGLASGIASVWVADGGTKIVVAGGSYSGSQAPQVLTTATGTYAPFAGRFGNAITGDLSRSPMSANGRFALSFGRSLLLVDTTGQHIVGANEGLSAGGYLLAGSFVSICSEPAAFNVYLLQPRPFVPAPVKAVITAKQGGTVIASGTITNALAYGTFQLPDDTTGWKVSGDYDATGPDVTLTATVTDGAGRVLSETWTEPDPYCGG